MIHRYWTIPILAYHRVGHPKGDHVPTISPDIFEWQLAFMARHRYHVIELEDVVGRLTQRETRLAQSVVITFDDGYEETFSVAAPILRRYGFRATVFVAPTELGLPGFMTWDQLRTIAHDGFSVGSHTMHHTYLPLVNPERAREDLVESKQLLSQVVGQPVEWLSYPVGGFTPEVQDLARSAGYRAACTTNRGYSKYRQDLFALRRIKMTERDRHPLLLRVKLSGYYDLFRRLEQPA